MWIYIPLLSAPDTAASNSDSRPLASISDGSTVLPLTWSGKPMRLRSLRAAWKRASWIRRLSGLTYAPSTLDAFAELWIASLRASRANRTASLARAAALTTSAGSGPTSSELFASRVHGSWCSKTSQASFLPEDSLPFSATWPRWGSMRNGECFLRDPLAPAIGESVSSSWPTATVASANGNGYQIGRDGERVLTISGAAREWATPLSSRRGMETPESLQMRRNKSGTGCSDLMVQAAYWPTPVASDCGEKVTENSNQAGLIGASYRFSRPDQPLPNGNGSSRHRLGSRPRLNPAFVCWLMGLPSWWTNIERTSCAPEEMASYRCRLQSQLSSFFAGSDSNRRAA